MKEVQEPARTLIKRAALREGCKRDGCLFKFGGRLYYINFDEDVVVRQLERK